MAKLSDDEVRELVQRWRGAAELVSRPQSHREYSITADALSELIELRAEVASLRIFFHNHTGQPMDGEIDVSGYEHVQIEVTKGTSEEADDGEAE